MKGNKMKKVIARHILFNADYSQNESHSFMSGCFGELLLEMTKEQMEVVSMIVNHAQTAAIEATKKEFESTNK